MPVHATVAYDIANARGRKLAHRLLEQHGEAVNFSVFEVEVADEAALDALLAQLEHFIEPTHDSVRATCIDPRRSGRWRGVRTSRLAVEVI